jgi:uncharacterized membrane-anchored protein YitT (DUF2179 family)
VTPTPEKQSHQYGFSRYYWKSFFWLVLGGFLAAFGVQVFLVPNSLVDGGIVGISIMAAYLTSKNFLPLFLILFNAPFFIIGAKQIGHHFVIQMLTAVAVFALSLFLFERIPDWFSSQPLEFHGDNLEIIVVGGFVIGIGGGLIIRHGGSTDGTEIMGIIINRKWGFTVGQVILFVNIFVFLVAGLIYQNWHSAFLSLMTYVVATKIMDTVIVGLDDTKSVMIISQKPRELAEILMRQLGVSLTVMYGRGGYSGTEREILYIVVERLQLSELKEIIHREDPEAFVAIENLHEVINNRKQGLHKLPKF